MSPSLQSAAERLDRALAALDAKARRREAEASVGDDDLFAPRSSAAQSELEAAAREASAALGRAADQIRALLDEED
jgi:hypothetical protein